MQLTRGPDVRWRERSLISVCFFCVWSLMLTTIMLLCYERGQLKIMHKESYHGSTLFVLLFRSWKKLDPSNMSVSETHNHYHEVSSGGFTVRIGCTFSWNVLKCSSLTYCHYREDISWCYCPRCACKDTCVCVCVFTLSSLVSDAHQWDFLLLFMLLNMTLLVTGSRFLPALVVTMVMLVWKT